MKQIQALTIIAVLVLSSVSFGSTKCAHRLGGNSLFQNTTAPSVAQAAKAVAKVAVAKTVRGVN